MYRAAFSLLFILAIFQACALLSHGSNQATSSVVLAGRVVALDGSPVSGASATAGQAAATSDSNGCFQLSASASPSWVTVSRAGFLPRTRAVAPGKQTLFRLTPDDGQTISIQFGGDVMFGRRFYDRNGDGDLSDGILALKASAEMHAKLFENVRPLLQSSDLTVVNLETPLANDPYYAPNGPRPARFHPTKEFVFASARESAAALKLVGIGLVDLANNHLYDMLEEGVSSTLDSLQTAGFREGAGYFGAGRTEDQAWAPAIVKLKGQSLAFFGCTLETGKTDSISYVAEGGNKGGAAACNEDAIRHSVAAAAASHSVIVMIHGGTEYDHIPTEAVRKMTAAARNAGAVLVINHHPHVVSGFDWNDRSLVAWSMGNFLFDQKLRPTFESLLLTVHLRQGRIVQAYAEPIIMDGYVPHGVTGAMAEWVARRAAGRQDGSTFVEDGAMAVDVRDASVSKGKKINAHPGIFVVPAGMQVTGFHGKRAALPGQDLLWNGDFEREAIGVDQAPLWDLDNGVAITASAAYSGGMGAHFQAKQGMKPASLTQTGRIPINPNDSLALTGMVRGCGLLATIRFFPDSKQAFVAENKYALACDKKESWTRFTLDIIAPPAATTLQLIVTLDWGNALTQADLDEIRLIQWEKASTPLGIGTGFLRLSSPGKVVLRTTRLP
jgi:poly-gamma-glutamate capsule biosynthesis protein CapA/YwtB (metallophosphatase superfamily)